MSDTPTITIYGAEWCGPCHMTKHYLTEKGFKYTYRNIDDDPNAAVEAVTKSGQRAIPVIDIDGKIIIGFDKPALDHILNIH